MPATTKPLILDSVTVEMIRHLRNDDGYSYERIQRVLGIALYRIWEVLGRREDARRYRTMWRDRERIKRARMREATHAN